MSGGTAPSEPSHGLKVLFGGGQGGSDRSYLAEVDTDLLQPGPLSRVDAEEWASDAAIFVRAARMGKEFVPFIAGALAIFFAGPLGPAAADERPMMGYHVFGAEDDVAELELTSAQLPLTTSAALVCGCVVSM